MNDSFWNHGATIVQNKIVKLHTDNDQTGRLAEVDAQRLPQDAPAINEHAKGTLDVDAKLALHYMTQQAKAIILETEAHSMNHLIKVEVILLGCESAPRKRDDHGVSARVGIITGQPKSVRKAEHRGSVGAREGDQPTCIEPSKQCTESKSEIIINRTRTFNRDIKMSKLHTEVVPAQHDTRHKQTLDRQMKRWKK